MKLTDALLGEHGLLYALFDHARDTALKSDDAAAVRETVAVLERLLLSHAEIEETMLFPRLDPHLGEMGPLAVMRDEHREIDALLEAARGEEDVGRARALVRDLLDIAVEHFRKEEMVLFPMAGELLGDAALRELGDDWANARKVEVSGQGCMGAA